MSKKEKVSQAESSYLSALAKVEEDYKRILDYSADQPIDITASIKPNHTGKQK